MFFVRCDRVSVSCGDSTFSHFVLFANSAKCRYHMMRATQTVYIWFVKPKPEHRQTISVCIKITIIPKKLRIKKTNGNGIAPIGVVPRNRIVSSFFVLLHRTVNNIFVFHTFLSSHTSTTSSSSSPLKICNYLLFFFPFSLPCID